MTRIEIHIDRLVLRGVPDELAVGIGPLVEARLAELASTGHPLDAPDAASARAGTGGRDRGARVGSRQALADLVANRVWSASRTGGASG
jgi:hypothetical protein